MSHDLATCRERREVHFGLLEVAVVSAVVLGLSFWARHADARRAAWVIPWVLTLGAVLPTIARGRSMRELGFRWGRVAKDHLWLGLGFVCMVLLGVVARTVLARWAGEPPLTAAVRQEHWLRWAFFQTVWVALPEELFFRGYVLSNSVRWVERIWRVRRSRAEFWAVLLSAGVFAFSHVLILGAPVTIITFFPGLIFAWSFVRMQTLIVPVLLHVAANVGYVMTA